MRAGARRISDISDEGVLVEHAERLLKRVLSLGADEAEVFGVLSRSFTIELRRDHVDSISESMLRGLGLRAVLKGGVGFSSTSDLSCIDEIASAALSAARIFGPDDAWRSLPEPAPVSEIDDVFDERIAEIDIDEILHLSEELLRGCKSVAGAEPVSGGISCIYSKEFLMNSNGIALSDVGTSLHIALEAISRDGQEVATGSEFDNSRRLNLDAYKVGERAAELACSSLGGASVDTGTYDVVLSPIAFAEIIESALIPSFSAENVQKGRSALADKLGQKIADMRVQIIDDGSLSGGMASSAFDGEGVPSRRNMLIDSGVLKSYLYDTYTAGKDGVSSTGNSIRSGYSDMPRIGIRNMIISSTDTRDIMEDVREGVLVNSVIGAHTANPISGDFSVEARNAFFIRDCEIAGPIKSAMIAGNVFDLIREMEVGRDRRVVGPIVTPSIKVRMRVVG